MRCSGTSVPLIAHTQRPGLTRCWAGTTVSARMARTRSRVDLAVSRNWRVGTSGGSLAYRPFTLGDGALDEHGERGLKRRMRW